MSKINKKFICIFDASHFVDSEDKLAKHMLKCKSMEKGSYLCCQYNPLHWVKHYDLPEHEQSCPDKIKQVKPPEDSFSKILPNDISRFQFSQPFLIDMSMVQSSSLSNAGKSSKKQPCFDMRNDDPNLMSKKQKQAALNTSKKTQLWVEPDIESFLHQKRYKKGKSEIRSYRNQPQSFIVQNESFMF